MNNNKICKKECCNWTTRASLNIHEESPNSNHLRSPAILRQNPTNASSCGDNLRCTASPATSPEFNAASDQYFQAPLTSSGILGHENPVPNYRIFPFSSAAIVQHCNLLCPASLPGLSRIVGYLPFWHDQAWEHSQHSFNRNSTSQTHTPRNYNSGQISFAWLFLGLAASSVYLN